MARLKETYQNEISVAMQKKFGYKNVMEIPKLDKIVINMGVGEAKENAKESYEKSIEEAERDFEGKGYGDFKLAVGEVCADALEPVRTEFEKLIKEKAYLEDVMRTNSEHAYKLARKTLSKVYRKVGFVQI